MSEVEGMKVKTRGPCNEIKLSNQMIPYSHVQSARDILKLIHKPFIGLTRCTAGHDFNE